MDILTPFLPRISHFHPVDKSTIVIVGVAQGKTTKVKRNKQTYVESHLDKKSSEQDKSKEREDDEHLDIWV